MARKPDLDLNRLSFAMQRARMVLRKFREERTEAVRQYVGAHWSDESTRQIVPVNLISLYTQIVGRNLVAKEPRLLLSTFQKQNKAHVNAMETWANKKLAEMGFAGTMQRVVLDALFSIGIAKVALASPAEASGYAHRIDAGQPFVERVDLDDFVFDVHARDFAEVSYIGHRYRVPIETIRDSKLYNKTRKDLQPSHHQLYNQEGDERIGTLGRGAYAGDIQEFEDFVDLWEVYIPRHRLVLTLRDDQLTGAAAEQNLKALREQDWIGPDTGPYHILAYQTVPGNAMPKGPLQDLIDLHELVNRLWRKLGNQAERQKTVGAVSSGAMEDGKRIMTAADGDLIRVDNPERTKIVSFPGPDNGNFLFVEKTRELFSWLAGNLDMMGGLSPQSRTAAQDKMLAENASGQVVSLQQDTVKFTADVCRSLCWYWWHHPFLTMRTKHSAPAMKQFGIDRQVTPADRQKMEWEDLELEVDPYSMQHATPQARLQAINQVMQQVVIPMMGVLQQQGIGLDLNAYLEKIGKYLNLPDLAELVTIQPPPAATDAASSSGPQTPGETTRNYVRRSLGQGSEQAKTSELQNQLAAAQPSQNGQPQPIGS